MRFTLQEGTLAFVEEKMVAEQLQELKNDCYVVDLPKMKSYMKDMEFLKGKAFSMSPLFPMMTNKATPVASATGGESIEGIGAFGLILVLAALFSHVSGESSKKKGEFLSDWVSIPSDKPKRRKGR